MSSTSTLDDNIAGLLHPAAQHEEQPATETAFRICPHQGVFADGVPLQKLNQFADELEMAA